MGPGLGAPASLPAGIPRHKQAGKDAGAPRGMESLVSEIASLRRRLQSLFPGAKHRIAYLVHLGIRRFCRMSAKPGY